ncbi:MAG: amidohydrolase family protein [Candidatus Tectomicrobia bacterium]|uniref:Amidohydrolase family protein n=1 Tax=Tectimicrobiota bacterium TaxID=2528274 RepID=A0A933GLX1_UNCTE|nr:amidohydrolase family protein [Candidatus Tectomicrobia bacterium]
MIIDFHAHIRMDTVLTPKYWKGWLSLASVASGASEERIRERIKDIPYLGAEDLIRDMDEAGIDKSVLLGVDFCLCKELDDYKGTWEECHEPIREAIQKHSDRLIGFVGIDPRRENAAALLENAVKDWGMKGLKIHPSAGFYPNDPVCYSLYAKASELGIPIVIHTGGEPYPFKVKWCHPVYIVRSTTLMDS